MTERADARRLGGPEVRVSSDAAGEAGLAQVVRLCHNLFSGAVAASMAEITLVAKASGGSREALPACQNKSLVGSAFTTYKSPAYVKMDFEPTSTSELLVQRTVGAGYGDVDFAAFIAQQAESAGITLESEHADVSDGLDPEET